MRISAIRTLLLVCVLVTILAASGCTASPAAQAGTQRVSVDSSGKQADHGSKQPSISADGRYVAFTSDAANLVSGDTNGVSDVFVRDLKSGTTTCVSVSNNGVLGDKASYWPFISADGRYVTFTSEADNLINGDTNTVGDVFVYDLQTARIDYVTIGTDGTPGNDMSLWSSISADGQYVVFMSSATNLIPSDTNDTWDVFLRDRSTRTTSLVSFGFDGTQANGESEYPVISADGGSIAFASDANNIVPGDTNGYRDVFEFNRKVGVATRVSVSTTGVQSNYGMGALVIDISSDGQFVAFPSLATNLVPDDTNNAWDIFVHDIGSGETKRVSVSSDGSQANNGSYGVSISSDGRYVAFGSPASNLVPDDTNDVMDVFVHDRQTGKTERISTATGGTQGNDASGFTVVLPSEVEIAYGALITADGSHVVYMSNATNLVADDTNTTLDIFVSRR